MSQIAQVSEAKRSLAPCRKNVSGVESRRRRTIRPHPGEPDEQRRHERRCAGRRHGDAPIDPAKRAEKVGRCRAEGECAHEESHHHSHVAFRPGGYELHADGIDTRHAHPRCDAQQRRDSGRWGHQEQKRIGGRSARRTDGEEPPRIDAVR